MSNGIPASCRTTTDCVRGIRRTLLGDNHKKRNLASYLVFDAPGNTEPPDWQGVPHPLCIVAAMGMTNTQTSSNNPDWAAPDTAPVANRRPDTYDFRGRAESHLLAGHNFDCDCPNAALPEIEVVRRTYSGLPACSPQWEKHVIDTIEGVVTAQAAAKREKDRITRIMNRKDGGQFRGGVDG